jgi:hypothetical protein
MNEIIEALTRFYGLDWITMMLGLTGTYLISKQDKRGLACNGMSCICSLFVAFMSDQSGFILYNVILIYMLVKGFRAWGRKQDAAVQS